MISHVVFVLFSYFDHIFWARDTDPGPKSHILVILLVIFVPIVFIFFRSHGSNSEFPVDFADGLQLLVFRVCFRSALLVCMSSLAASVTF